jgi:hypothetical protein
VKTDPSLFAAIVWASVSMAAASPVSNCVNDIGDSGFACNFFGTLANGTASQSSNVVSFPVGQSVVSGYVVLLESPGASHTDPTQWSGEQWPVVFPRMQLLPYIRNGERGPKCLRLGDPDWSGERFQ